MLSDVIHILAAHPLQSLAVFIVALVLGAGLRT